MRRYLFKAGVKLRQSSVVEGGRTGMQRNRLLQTFTVAMCVDNGGNLVTHHSTDPSALADRHYPDSFNSAFKPQYEGTVLLPVLGITSDGATEGWEEGKLSLHQ